VRRVERIRTEHVALVLVIAATVAWRLWVIRHYPDPDTDAKGHLGIARALLSHPFNVSIHWVYLPAYHFVLAALEAIGFSGDAIRMLNCALAATVPLLALRYAQRTGAPRSVSVMAAFFCAVSPLVNLLGTSAQQETLFVLLVLGAVYALDAQRFALAGALLAIASLVRYEAWGAVALVVACRVLSRRPALRFPVVVFAPALAAIGAWLLAHRLSDGQWFGFLRELYRYTHLQRDTIQRAPTWFSLQQPLFVFGWMIAILFFAGVRRAARASWVLPLGIYLFLQAAWLFKGALGSARYYESFVPFVAIAAAYGVDRLSASRKWVASSIFAVAFVQLAIISSRTLPWSWPRPRADHATAGARSGAPLT
jgi:hypothetical protein